MVAVVVVAAVSALALTDLHTRSDVRRTDAQLARLEHRTHVVLEHLAATRLALAVQRTQQTVVRADLAQVDVELNSTDARLSSTNYILGQESAYVDELNTCLTGVEEALNSLSVGDTADAVTSLNGVHAECTEAQTGA